MSIVRFSSSAIRRVQRGKADVRVGHTILSLWLPDAPRQHILLASGTAESS